MGNTGVAKLLLQYGANAQAVTEVHYISLSDDL
jgi:hypothetical protein